VAKEEKKHVQKTFRHPKRQLLPNRVFCSSGLKKVEILKTWLSPSIQITKRFLEDHSPVFPE
jgi:hypothetical protein